MGQLVQDGMNREKGRKEERNEEVGWFTERKQEQEKKKS